MHLILEPVGVNKMKEASVSISFAELCESQNVNRAWVIEIIEYGIAEPISGNDEEDWHFDATSIMWLKRALRLYHDFEIDWIAVAMVIELLKQKQLLETKNKTLQRQLQRFYHSDA